MKLTIVYREENRPAGLEDIVECRPLSYEVKDGCLIIRDHNDVSRGIPLDRIAYFESDLRG